MHTHCPDGGGGACGDLLLGNTCIDAPRQAKRSHWQLYTGLAVEGAALVAVGVGGSQLFLSDKRRQKASGTTGMGEKAYLLDQAEQHERLAAWSFGIGAPLAILGGAFMLADVLIKDPSPARKSSETDRSEFKVMPAMDGAGSMGIQMELTF